MIRKWKVALRGHTAIFVADVRDSHFVGHIESDEYGFAPITDGSVAGAVLSGRVTLDGVNARFSATIDPDARLRGYVQAGWFVHADFEGEPIA